ncbi:hypothetical protein ACQPWY_26785 [Pseudonocardia xinjiangensis]|uniref:hypothetical protein n=1 Tax=Pseudonocardia xinjiangensis TaxID=75289 RepID=UPI003D9012E9
MIGMESRLYAGADVTADLPLCRFVVADRHEAAADTVSFVLTPDDGAPWPDFTPGQYVTVAVDLPGNGRRLRQFYEAFGAVRWIPSPAA